MNTPKHLFPGARVALVAPSSAVPAEKLEPGLEFVRKLLRCEVLEESLPEGNLLGLSEAQLRKHSHFPQEYYGQPHFAPSARDGSAIAWLNRARCAAREAELAAVEAFTDREGIPTRPDLLRGMNRVSSGLYLLMIRQKAGKTL